MAPSPSDFVTPSKKSILFHRFTTQFRNKLYTLPKVNVNITKRMMTCSHTITPESPSPEAFVTYKCMGNQFRLRWLSSIDEGCASYFPSLSLTPCLLLDTRAPSLFSREIDRKMDVPWYSSLPLYTLAASCPGTEGFSCETLSKIQIKPTLSLLSHDILLISLFWVFQLCRRALCLPSQFQMSR